MSQSEPSADNVVQSTQAEPMSPTDWALAYAAERSQDEPQNPADIVLRLTAQIADLTAQIATLTAQLTQLQAVEQRAQEKERRLNALTAYTERLQESYRQLQLGLRRHAADKPNVAESQVALDFVLEEQESPDEIQPEFEPATARAPSDPAPTARTVTPHGRRKLEAELPRIVMETRPLEVTLQGLENFDLIGFEETSTIAYRRGGHVLFVEARGKYVPVAASKGQSRPAPHCPGEGAHNTVVVQEQDVVVVPADPGFTRNPFPCGAIVRYLASTQVDTSEVPSAVLIAPLAERPIAKGFADPSLLAHLVVGKMDYHLPYYRQERQMQQLGLSISRSNMVRWHFEVGAIAARIASAMWDEAMQRSWFGMDATSTAIFDKEKYRHGHIFVVVAPGDSVLYQFTPKYDGATVEKLFAGFSGVIVADASANHNGLFGPGAATEAGCWAHCRRYVVTAHRAGFRTHADQALLLIKQLFQIEQEIALLSPDDRLRIREQRSAPIVDRFFDWVDQNKGKVSDSSALGRAFTYASNQREALRAFLSNAQIPIHNNACERALRQVVKGRQNWLFMQSDQHARRSCAIYSIVASCHLHGLDPEFYLQEILTVAPSWPLSKVLELSPKNWVETRKRLIRQGRLKYVDIGSVLAGNLGLRS